MKNPLLFSRMKASAYRLTFPVLLMLMSFLPARMSYAQDTSVVYPVTAFSTLEVSGSALVEFTQGPGFEVAAKGNPSAVEGVSVKSKDNILRISARTAEGLVIKVTAPSVEKIRVSGAAGLTGKNLFVQDVFSVETGGAANLKMEVQVKSLDAGLSGASVMTLSGTADSLILKMSGAANGRFEDLAAKDAQVNASGASSGKLNVTDKVAGKVTAAASVKFTTDPPVNQLETSGALLAGDDEQPVVITEEIMRDVEDGDIKIESIKKMMKNTGKKKKFNGHFGGVELGINTYLNQDNAFELPAGADYMELKMPNSLMVNLNLLEANLPIIKHHLGIVTGLGIEFNNYKFEGSNFIRKINGEITPEPAPAGIEFEKSKLSCSYLKVPFLLEYQTNSGSSKNSFHIAGGVSLGLRLRSHTKYMYELNGKEVKEKEWDRFYLNPYRVAYVAKIGWGPLNFFAEYNILSLFDKGKGPELYPVNFGIALANWD
ncbi:MAG TPA: DUF2807 domain-containing protein [Bacteroidales bacterium]|nr:DUF2807 domain-containing protein [Bacteroidales bacterium]HRZ48025.1 DUF2807 domain-containing protein [Bacteroidales bacterium]